MGFTGGRTSAFAFAFVLVVALAGAGCGRKALSCNPGTLFVTVNYDGATKAADHLEVQVTVAGSTETAPQSLPHASGALSGTLEIDFSSAGGGYPAGKRVDVTVTAATASGATLGTASGFIEPLPDGCGTMTINFIDDVDGGAGAGGVAGSRCSTTRSTPSSMLTSSPSRY